MLKAKTMKVRYKGRNQGPKVAIKVKDEVIGELVSEGCKRSFIVNNPLYSYLPTDRMMFQILNDD